MAWRYLEIDQLLRAEPFASTELLDAVTGDAPELSVSSPGRSEHVPVDSDLRELGGLFGSSLSSKAGWRGTERGPPGA